MSSSCCERYKKGKKPCKDCPTMAALNKKERRKLRRKHKAKRKPWRHGAPASPRT